MTRRTICSWETAPRDGTPFHILNTLRFNPFAKRFEALCVAEDGSRVWANASFIEHNEPSVWLRLVPLPYDVPTSFAFTYTYEIRRKSLLDRIITRLFGFQQMDFHRCFASAMSAREGQDRETGLEAKPASAVGATSAETPNPSHRSTGE